MMASGTGWERRYEWLRQLEEMESGPGSHFLSKHGVLASYDVEIAFCSGAWMSVIILAHTAIDASLRDLVCNDYDASAKRVFGDNEEFQWLRALRNRLVHAHAPGHARELPDEAEDDVAAFHASLEPAARRAVTLMYRALFVDRGT